MNSLEVWEERCPGALGFWSETYLASFAIAGEYRFATLHRGFRHFPVLDLLSLDS